MTKPESVGQRLRAARRRLRLSQTAVADYLSTTRQVIAGFEQDKRQPDLGRLVLLANLYRMTPDEITGATSVARRAAMVPKHLPRLNRQRGLAEQDENELVEFEAYLKERSAAQTPSFSRATFESVAQTATRVLDQFEVKEPPVPIFAVLARCGIEVRFTQLDELAGAFIAGDAARPHGILVSSDQPNDRQRFTAAHEFGHLVLADKPGTSGAFVSYLGRRFDPIEVRADRFAAELLMPGALLQRKASQLPSNAPLAENVYRLASLFMVSFQAMTMRLVKLGMIEPEDEKLLAKEKPGLVAKRVGPIKATSTRVAFQSSWLKTIVQKVLPQDWRAQLNADVVRLLQEQAWTHYVSRADDSLRADDVGGVYSAVAKWVADHYPLIKQ